VMIFILSDGFSAIVLLVSNALLSGNLKWRVFAYAK